MLLFSESNTKIAPLGETSTANGSIPSLLPSKTVSTVYPPSNFIMERLEIAEKTNPISPKNQSLDSIQRGRKTKMQRKIGNRLNYEAKLPVLGADFSDHSHLTRADTTFETTEVTISAKNQNEKQNLNKNI